ncbi:class I SAM-dependent methyltransferase [Roseiconus lacunae]|uniref:class I SAM-dependent methyltransferase n=1 Tax=Roseiconus lacunae TaxID=2605694 RepID=UPI003091306A|nr:class I SAM-dependent methyltransferase [Stieleria sp. HD01]
MILDEVYRQLSENAWNYRPDEITSWRLARKLLLRQAQTQTQIRIVDVGAFSGQFLSMLPQQWTKAAVEPCLSVRQSLAERRIEWLADFVENVPPDHFEQFDVVTLFDVFEHLPAPSETLRDAIRLLRPGGKLLLSTGNSGHWSWRLLGGQHWYLHTLQHLCFASQRSLRWIAKTQGLRIMSLIRHSHKRRCLREKVRHCVETVHWSARRHQGWKQSIAGLIQRLPSHHGLVHRDRAPMAISLKDHLLVCFEKPVV